jgi:O-acetyl-ADP-ribose deacetylase
MSTILITYTLSPATSLEIAHGDLTQEPVDAIVNAANKHLSHGSGVAGAIVHKGGSDIQRESDDWVNQHGQVTNAEPAYTHAGTLPAHYVIHAVGPVWGEGNEDAKLDSAIRGSLKRAEELGCQSIAFPAISTGIFGFPLPRAARIFFRAFQSFFKEALDSKIQLVRLTLWNDETVKVFLEEGEQALGRSSA